MKASNKQIYEKCILLIENTEYAERRISNYKKDIKNYANMGFQSIISHYKNRVQTLESVIYKLDQYYNYLIKKL